MRKPHPATTYVLYSVIFRFGLGFIMVSLMPWLSSLGLTMAEIAVVNGVFCLGTALAEVPTGMLADGKSRSWSIRLGLIMFALSMVMYAQAGTLLPNLGSSLAAPLGLDLTRHQLIVLSAALCEATAAVGNAFMSGADQAWVTDALYARGEHDRLGRVFGTVAALKSAALLIGGFLGGMIGGINLQLPWYAAGITVTASLIISMTMMNGEGEPAVRVSEMEALRRGWKVMRNNPALIWTTSAAVVYSLVHPFNLYWTLRFEPLTGVSGLSWVWVAAYGSLVAAGWYVRNRPHHRRESRGVAVSITLTGLGIMLAGLTSGLLMPMAFVMISEIGRGAYEPLLSALTQRHVSSEYRATYGSLQSFASMSGFGLVTAILYVTLRDQEPTIATINTTWIISGLTLTACSFVLWRLRKHA